MREKWFHREGWLRTVLYYLQQQLLHLLLGQNIDTTQKGTYVSFYNPSHSPNFTPLNFILMTPSLYLGLFKRLVFQPRFYNNFSFLSPFPISVPPLTDAFQPFALFPFSKTTLPSFILTKHYSISPI